MDSPLVLIALAVLLVAAVAMAVHHAEVVALKVGEPYGTLILAVCVTVIEVALIAAVMLSGNVGSETIARDAVFAAIMIVANGVVGISILAGGIRHHELAFRIEGSNSALTVLIALATLTLVLPGFTTSSAGPTYINSQLIFAGICSLALYGTFVFIQTVRHRDYFLPVESTDLTNKAVHVPPPSHQRAARSGALLLGSLIVVVVLAKALTPAIEQLVTGLGAPKALVGVMIAALVLAPESIAAIRAALANRLQTSLNLALGSALASIGLTIPTVAVLSIVFDRPLTLGIGPVDIILLVLTLLASITTIAGGKTAVLQGAVHLMIFLAYLFLTIVP
ncbi:MAG: ionic transporter y4hA [Burkholderiaceae bacterium]|nr:ionic transporter y4hA [Burkholderiaceae bacterium]